jgi:ParB-like chromosome segregation protein Spo0J
MNITTTPVVDLLHDFGMTTGKQLEQLRKQASEPAASSKELPSELPVAAITHYEDLFQHRALEEKHLGDLARVIRQFGKFDPILLIRVGTENVLIDGHHRMEAYQRAEIFEPVPVVWFSGTVDEAVLEAGRSNSKAKLQMTKDQRTNYAWRLVRLGGYSKAQIVEASGTSEGTVATMRRVMKALGEEAHLIDQWWEARAKHKGTLGDDPEWDEDRIEALSESYAERLTKAFGTKLANNTTVAARALELHFGRRFDDLIEELGVRSRENDAEENEDF